MWGVRCVSLAQLCGTYIYYHGLIKAYRFSSYRYESPAGLFITIYVYVMYIIALRYEGYVLSPYFLMHSSSPLIDHSPMLSILNGQQMH